jgi:hypothetical protein
MAYSSEEPSNCAQQVEVILMASNQALGPSTAPNLSFNVMHLLSEPWVDRIIAVVACIPLVWCVLPHSAFSSRPSTDRCGAEHLDPGDHDGNPATA